MFSVNRSIGIASTLVVVLSLGALPARAQGVAQSGGQRASCYTNPQAAGAFERCALTLKGVRLQRNGEVIAKYVFPHPIALSQIVTGDSAIRYARLYEHHTIVAQQISGVGVAFIIGPVLANHLRSCRTTACPASEHRRATIGGIVGGSLIAISIPFFRHGVGEAKKSVSIYNASLGK